MTGGVMSRRKSRVTRDCTSSPPESTWNTLLSALTLPVPSVPYTKRGQRHQRTAALEMRHDRRPSRSKHWPPWWLASFDTSMLQSSSTSILDESRPIEGSTIGAIIHRTTSCHQVPPKTYYGVHRPQDLIFSILDIRDTKFMLHNIVGH